MPIQDVSATRKQKETAREEKVIIRAVSRYFETAPSPLKSTAAELSILNAFNRYFGGKR